MTQSDENLRAAGYEVGRGGENEQGQEQEQGKGKGQGKGQGQEQEKEQGQEQEQKQKRVLLAAESLVKAKLERDSSGHDWWHIYRVVQTTKRIATEEGADGFVCELAALLHDVVDEKLNADPAAAQRELEAWLAASGTPTVQVEHVLEIISTMSYKGGSRAPMRTLEGQVVQDADRLDAIGAVGISRVFAYSGWKGRPIHDPSVTVREQMTEAEYRGGNDTAINHFYEKLLKLKELMNTAYARKMAEERHHFMEQYLAQFYAEWEGEN
ncbi:HD domain-containing protein [Paenibacillus sp. SYP-B3998]|uniref:HD domain-containing protein n=1 Tax=Paenibacillus sp. SYP-B3998 TaxID=2678564 RepID=A0A6G3ZXR2_9BACL|nr:HD domain-containing protein [Paenibacillus sp. SYP-B3998]NEW07003.1 HD domain-containing protein [Paenibacillus sp. SYP-B3998]